MGFFFLGILSSISDFFRDAGRESWKARHGSFPNWHRIATHEELAQIFRSPRKVENVHWVQKNAYL